jgi:hypothetical protein
VYGGGAYTYLEQRAVVFGQGVQVGDVAVDRRDAPSARVTWRVGAGQRATAVCLPQLRN